MSTKNTTDDVIRLNPEQMVRVATGVPRRRRSKDAKQATAAGTNKRTRGEFVVLINGAKRKTVEGIVEQGEYLKGAADELPYGEYDAMVEEDLEIDPGWARKLRKIAKNTTLANRENFHALPARPSVLYELAFLKPEYLQVLIDEGIVHAKMTAEQAHALRSPRPEPVPHQCAICADTARVPDGHQWHGHDDEGAVEIAIEDQDATADLVEGLVTEVRHIFGRPRSSTPTLRQKIER